MDENKCGMSRLRRWQLMGQALPSGWGQVERCQAVYEGLNPLSNDVEEMMDASVTKCLGGKRLWGLLPVLKGRSPIQRYRDQGGGGQAEPCEMQQGQILGCMLGIKCPLQHYSLVPEWRGTALWRGAWGAWWTVGWTGAIMPWQHWVHSIADCYQQGNRK